MLTSDTYLWIQQILMATGAGTARAGAASSTAVDIFTVTQPLAPFFPRPRPFTFPSGHAIAKLSATILSLSETSAAEFAGPPRLQITASPTSAVGPQPAPSTHSGTPPVAAARMYGDLPKSLPFLHGAHPKLKSAAAVLAGKRCKTMSKLKRATQPFDYLSDEMSDDWEDKEDSYKAPKRYRDGLG